MGVFVWLCEYVLGLNLYFYFYFYFHVLVHVHFYSLFHSNSKKKFQVSRVYEFCEREFAVEVRATDAAAGTFDLACFVKTAMVVVRVTVWDDVERGCLDRSDVRIHFSFTTKLAKFLQGFTFSVDF